MAAARRQHAVAAQGKAALHQTFTAYGEPLKRVQQFRYLGHIVFYDDNDTPAVRKNIKRARRTCDSSGGCLRRRRYRLELLGYFIKQW